MEQKTLQKTHYEIFGYSYNPAIVDLDESDPKLEADHKFWASTKREVVGYLKVMLDNFNCEHIAIFRVDGVPEKKGE